MFIAQSMYAEGLVKVMAAILGCVKNEPEIRSLELEIAERKAAFTQLAHNAHGRGAEIAHCSRVLGILNQRLAGLKTQHSEDAALLDRCKINAEERRTKFDLIAADCLRIGHGSVQPPVWA